MQGPNAFIFMASISFSSSEPENFLNATLECGLCGLSLLKNTNTCNKNATKINAIKIINILFQKLRLILTFSSGWG